MGKDQELLIKINGQAKQFVDEIDRVNKKTKDLQRGLATVAKTSAVAFTALASAVGATVVRFSAFESKFTNVVTLLDKGSFSSKTLTQGIDDLKRGVLALGAESGESFENLNQGLFDLISAGVDAEDAVSTLRAATQLALAGATDTATAVKALTASITAFGSEAGSATDIAEKFFTAQKFGVTTVGELATEFNKIGGLAVNLGISFDEALASLSSLTANGAKPTAQAATELRAVFNALILTQSKLSGESFEVRDALSLQNIQSRGLTKSLELLKTAVGGDVVEMQRLLGSSEALGAVLSLTGAQSELVATQIDAIGNAAERAATFQDALATKQQTTEAAMKRLGAAVDAVAIQFGEAFAPTVNAAASALAAIAVKFSELDRETIETTATITKWVLSVLAGVTAITTLTLGFIKFKAAVGAAATALGLKALATKAAALATRLYRNSVINVAVAMNTLKFSIRGLLGATGIGLLLVILGAAITDFGRFKATAVGTFEAIKTISDRFLKGISTSFSGLKDILIGAFTLNKDKIAKGIQTIKDSVVEGYEGLGTAASEAFKKGYDASLASGGGEESVAPGLNTEEAKVKREEDLANNKEFLNEKTKQEIEDAELRKQIKEEEEKAEAEREKESRKQFLKDEAKFGTEFAKINQAINSQEVEQAKKASSELVGLTASKNKQVKQIGKAASIVQIGIKTAEGAISAYSSLAGIPFIGPALGIAAAGAVVAYGAEQAAAVRSAQRGGIVPGASGGARDRVPMMLEPGEIVVPKPLAPDFIQSMGRSDLSGGASSGQDVNVIVGFRDEAFQIIEQKLLENRAIGTGVL